MASLRATAAAARASVGDAARLAETYLAGTGQFPERSHLNALVGDLITDVLLVIARHCERASAEVGSWETTGGHGLDDSTRARFRRVIDSASRGPEDQPLS